MAFAAKQEHDRWVRAAAHASSRELAAVILTAMEAAERFSLPADEALSDVIRTLRKSKRTAQLYGGWAQEARTLVQTHVLGV
jgi:hypothetical protein